MFFDVRFSEKSQTKCIGITIETRPDYCLKRHLGDMLNYGCTRLEIGVQSVYEDVARDTNRGHTVRAVCESFQQVIYLSLFILFGEMNLFINFILFKKRLKMLDSKLCPT